MKKRKWQKDLTVLCCYYNFGIKVFDNQLEIDFTNFCPEKSSKFHPVHMLLIDFIKFMIDVTPFEL